jgi:hypothetical protein
VFDSCLRTLVDVKFFSNVPGWNFNMCIISTLINSTYQLFGKLFKITLLFECIYSVIELDRDAILFCNILCSCLQIPNDFSKMFDKDLFKLDTAVVPEVLR